ncbi:hypothetical protein KORDIASMS9_03837 [Kordia sp. SMS9]|uniref:hypothetical protein n=1 Tax=Kordia sp. SMS9 TaxID=2282170 RepID=UPI000E102F8A|nr:hypothetical protein [Kordia sp. SMS9]AXG71580.1 hypothetical protein KORDIASMS9_03837 [Kordia sp. SMS9]
MLKNLKQVSGAVAISKTAQKSIIGGNGQPFNNPAYFECLRSCGGSCSGDGRCFYMEK